MPDMVVRLRIVLLTVLLAVSFAGCAYRQPQPEPPPLAVEVPPAEPAPPAQAEVAPEPPPPPVRTETHREPPPPRVTDTAAIVLSNRTPAFENVATELALRLDDYLLYNLADKSLSPEDVFASIDELDAKVVIAIGLEAAREAISRSSVPVVFCQVFNIDSRQDTSVPVRGVASTPPLSLQVAAWKQRNPRLGTIGAILGTGHDELLAEAAEAAAENDVALRYRTTNSDRETLFAFQRLAPTIEGFWLFPDNRVLSVEILRELLDYAAQHDVEVAVFNDALLQMGASVSFTTVESDIAATVLSVAGGLLQGEAEEIPWLTPLHDVSMRTEAPADRIELAAGSRRRPGGVR